MRDELAFEGVFEDGLAETLGAGELGADGLLDLISDGEEAVDLAHDSLLLRRRRKREWRSLEFFQREVRDVRRNGRKPSEDASLHMGTENELGKL